MQDNLVPHWIQIDQPGSPSTAPPSNQPLSTAGTQQYPQTLHLFAGVLCKVSVRQEHKKNETSQMEVAGCRECHVELIVEEERTWTTSQGIETEMGRRRVRKILG